MNDDKKRTVTGNPLDPTTDAQQQFIDPTGLTGITDTDQHVKDIKSGQDLLEQERNRASSQGMIEPDDPRTIDIAGEAELKDINSDEVQQELLEGNANDTLDDATPPDVFGEQSVSGDMPDPESDDNMLDNMHQFGVALNADEDDPKELDIAGDVAAAERSRRGM